MAIGWIASLSLNARQRAGVFRSALILAVPLSLGGCASCFHKPKHCGLNGPAISRRLWPQSHRPVAAQHQPGDGGGAYGSAQIVKVESDNDAA
jgi:hypothetical protein